MEYSFLNNLALKVQKLCHLCQNLAADYEAIPSETIKRIWPEFL